jgi:hypothetical protein
MRQIIKALLTFVKDALSENGTPSIKRVTLIILLFAFLAECLYNIITGKVLSSVLTDQLYYAMIACLGVIFRINILQGEKDVKITQSNNNASVGAASPPPPPPDTTTVVK